MPKKYPYPQNPEKPQVTTDMVVFKVIKDQLNILLVKRGTKPFKGMWALPGGRVNKGESLDKTAKRELYEETGVKNIFLEQLYTFGEPNRDPRGRVISVAYFALINQEPKLRASTDTVDARWFVMKKLPALAFDHQDIIDYALMRLRWKLEYTNIVRNLLPQHFTLSNLQKVYEIILNKKIDKRNFRKKILSLHLIKPARRNKINVPFRPPQLWTFRTDKHVVLTKRELNF